MRLAFLLAIALHQIEKKRGNGERADASRNGRDIADERGHMGIIDISDYLALVIGSGKDADPYVYDGLIAICEIGSDELWDAGCHDEYVRLLCDLGNVLGLAMADGYFGALVSEIEGSRLPYQI